MGPWLFASEEVHCMEETNKKISKEKGMLHTIAIPSCRNLALKKIKRYITEFSSLEGKKKNKKLHSSYWNTAWPKFYWIQAVQWK